MEIKVYKKLPLEKEGPDAFLKNVDITEEENYDILSGDAKFYFWDRDSKLQKFIDRIKRPFRVFRIGVKNLIRWRRIIWNDRNWDHSYAYEILQYKLELMRNVLANGVATYDHRDLINSRITICLNLIERIKDGYYEHLYISKVADKWKRESFVFIPVPGSSNYTMKPTFKKELTASEKAQYDFERSKAYELGVKKHKQAKRILFKILERHLDSWWD